ncbi:MAG TPA: pectate lyase [Thermoanaerobaculia bacterium]|nr:pectate lyase [Thermoanaerobaculia bacterium]
MTDTAGWGRGFKGYVGPDAAVLNFARGGRSSKSFRNEGLWDELLRSRPSHVLIQFGHNDMPGKGHDRETDLPAYRANLARYVDEARAAGAEPILITPLTRRYFDGEERIRSDLEAHAEATRQVAAQKRVPLVDLHARSIRLLESLGSGISPALGPLEDDGILDKTHLTDRGSALFGALMAQEIRRVVPSLAAYVREATLPEVSAPWSVRMAESVMKRNPDPMWLDTTTVPRWEYTQGLVMKSILDIYRRTGDERLLRYVKTYYDGMIDEQGEIGGLYKMEDYNIDRINPGKPLFFLYEKTRDEKYRKAIETLREQMRGHPRTHQGGFWHKKRYPWQMWLDGLYMGAPFLAQYAVTFDEPALLDDVITQFILMEKNARDANSGLLYHGWDESRQQKWADPQTGRSPEFWGRAMGWFAMGLVETLDFVPVSHPRRGELVAILVRLAEAVVKVQDPQSGVWWQVLDDGGREGNYLESSVSSMLSFALMRAARTGVLDAKYGEAGRRAYDGILDEFIEVDDGLVNIHRVVQVAGLGGDPEKGERDRSGTFEYYISEPVRSNDPKAVGPFIFASLEYERCSFAILAGCSLVAADKPIRWGNDVLRQDPQWYASPAARAIAGSVIQYQSPQGGWPKSTNLAVPPRTAGDVPAPGSSNANTLDNDATTLPMQFLARVAHATGEEKYREAFLRGVDYLLAAQYPNGGFPQFFPLRKGYPSRITFNDDAMIRAMTVLRDVAAGRPPYDFVDGERRAKAAAAVARGIDLILRTQVRQNGKLTAWSAQHDETTLEPAWGRSFEPPSLSGSESVGIVRFLMQIEKPDPAVIAAVEGAVEWFRSVPIRGMRLEEVAGNDKRLVADPAAPPLWARFYELGTNRPIFLGRDSVVRYDFNEIEQERRTGYAYHGTWPATLLSHEYPQWRARVPDAIVAADGSGHYTSLQEAISRAPMNTAESARRWIIVVKPGIYRERVYVQRERGNIAVIGENAETTIITSDLHANVPGADGKPIGTFRTPTVHIDGDGMLWENVTIANGAGRPGPRPGGPPVAQAVALRVDADRVIFRRCRFVGWQDTLLVNRGRHYFADCYIEGSVDFIFGGATAVFDRCHIHAVEDGYITAASTPHGTEHGLVFIDCRITGSEGTKTYLGRPWRIHAKTVFLRTHMSAVVRPEGWHNWNKPEAEATVFYAESGSTGAGASPATRVAWARSLTEEEVAALTPQRILGGTDGWNPHVIPSVARDLGGRRLESPASRPQPAQIPRYARDDN